MNWSTRLFELFGSYDKLIDSYKDVNGQGIEERFQNTIGQSIEDELMGLINDFLPNTRDPQTLLVTLLPYAELLLGYDTKNRTLQLGTSVAWRRRVLAHMVRYYHIKGTKRCYELLFALMGLTVTITEYWNANTFDSFAPDITFDTDDRPVLDIGKCTPCSRYEIEVIGTPAWNQISAGFLSIILFNEPINAYQGLYTYNGQPIGGGGPTGLPCPPIAVTLTPFTEVGMPVGTFKAHVAFGSQSSDVTVGVVEYTVDGGTLQASSLNGGSDGDLGPFNFGEQIRLRVHNTQRPLCITLEGPVTYNPSCPIPLIVVTQIADMLNIEMTDDVGGDFIADGVRYSVNNSSQVLVSFDGSSSINIGPFLDGDLIEIYVDNATLPACNFYVGPFILPVIGLCDIGAVDPAVFFLTYDFNIVGLGASIVANNVGLAASSTNAVRVEYFDAGAWTEIAVFNDTQLVTAQALTYPGTATQFRTSILYRGNCPVLPLSTQDFDPVDFEPSDFETGIGSDQDLIAQCPCSGPMSVIPVFVCAGPGYASIQFGPGGGAWYMNGSGSTFAQLNPDGTITIAPSSNSEGSYCAFLSDPSGEPEGAANYFTFVGDVIAHTVNGLTSLTSYHPSSSSAASLPDISALADLNAFSPFQCPLLETLPSPETNINLALITLNNCPSLTEEAVLSFMQSVIDHNVSTDPTRRFYIDASGTYPSWVSLGSTLTGMGWDFRITN